jgi:hypothetical protein
MQATIESRRFYAGLGLWCLVLALVGFVPSFYLYVTGEYFFPAIVHVHGAIMIAWVGLYTFQASLIARGNPQLHRRVGSIAVWWAFAVWLSMAVATVVALRRFDPQQMGFLVQPLLIQLGTIVVFPLLVIWAVVWRTRPEWHKRLMTLATFVCIQAAVDRYHWLPDEGLPMFWHNGLRLYLLMLLPLWAYDALSLRRIHAATLTGSAIIVAMHGIVSFYWEHEGWRQLARSFWMWVR